MAIRDYIVCAGCDCKLIYDGNDSAREWLEERFGDPAYSDYTVDMFCPDCQEEKDAELESLRQRVAELEKDRDAWRDGAKEANREQWEMTTRITELEAVIKSHGIPVKTYAGGEAHYVMGEPK